PLGEGHAFGREHLNPVMESFRYVDVASPVQSDAEMGRINDPCAEREASEGALLGYRLAGRREFLDLPVPRICHIDVARKVHRHTGGVPERPRGTSLSTPNYQRLPRRRELLNLVVP